jgi:hypothetical protein
VKLYVRTLAGTGLGINVLLTGQVHEDGGTIRRVEIYMPLGCDLVIGYYGTAITGASARGATKLVMPLPKGRGDRQLLCVDSGDLCANDGSTLDQETLRAEVKRVNDQNRADMMHGPLGENWP